MTQLEALKEIAKRDGGFLRPQAVVDAARPKSSPLHNAFTWNDGEAARRYRLLQAQNLIRSFKITTERDGEEVTTPVFIGVSSDRTDKKANNPYRYWEDVANSDLVEIAESDALEQLRGIKARYDHLKRLGDIWAAIEKYGGAVRGKERH